jgi:uncharacterized integral membrane protein
MAAEAADGRLWAPWRPAGGNALHQTLLSANQSAMRLVIGLPFLVLIVLFALSNTAPVRIGLWPAEVTWEAPLAFAVLIAAGIAFLLGAVMVWIPALALRRRARRAEKTVRILQEQLDDLRARQRQSSTLAPPPPV